MTIPRLYNATVGALLCIVSVAMYANGDGWGLLIAAAILGPVFWGMK